MEGAVGYDYSSNYAELCHLVEVIYVAISVG